MFRWIAVKAIDKVLVYVDKKLAQDPEDKFFVAGRTKLLDVKAWLQQLKHEKR
jgi:hypothetical protein